MLWLSIVTLVIDGLLIYLRVRESRPVKRRPVSAWVSVAPGMRVRSIA